MTDYTPTTEQVREQYSREQPPHIGTVSEKRVEFDRWLDHVKYQAWEEGHEAAAMRVPEGVWHDTATPRPVNPYRKETDA